MMKNLISIILLLTIILLNCSKGSDDEPDSPVNIIDPALVGEWEGTIDGTPGSASITINLMSDGGFSGESNDPDSFYCPANGEWFVRNDRVNLSGNDTCDGTSISMSAPYSTTVLTGTWSASSGVSGTFSVTKQ